MIKRILPIYKTGWFYLMLLFWGTFLYYVSVGGLNSINQLNINLLEKKIAHNTVLSKLPANNATALTDKDILTLYTSFDEDNVTDVTNLLSFYPSSVVVFQGIQSKEFINKLSQYLTKKPRNNKIIIESAYELSATPLTISSTMVLSSLLNWLRFDQSQNIKSLNSKHFIYTPFLQSQQQSFPLVWQHNDKAYLSLPGEILRQLNLKNELTLNQYWQLSLSNKLKGLDTEQLMLGFLGEVFTSGNAYNTQISIANTAVKTSSMNSSKILPSISQFITQQYGTSLSPSAKPSYKIIIITDNDIKSNDRLVPLLLKLTENNYLSQSLLTILFCCILMLIGFALIWLIQHLSIKQQVISIAAYVVALFILQSFMFSLHQWLEVLPAIFVITGTWVLFQAYTNEVNLIESRINPQTSSPQTDKFSPVSKNNETEKQTVAPRNESKIITNPQLYKSPQNVSPAATIAPKATGWGHLVKDMSNKKHPDKSTKNSENVDLADIDSTDLEQTLVINVSDKKKKNSANQYLEMENFGRYQIEGILGKGAMGIVYQGVDPKINRHVAIKTLQLANDLDADKSTEAKERFFREAQTAGGLSHANIVTIYDVGEENNLGYIAMDLLTGAPLSVFTQVGQTLPVPLIYQLLIQITDALEYAHNQNVVHRDIKPGNIIYDDDLLKVTVTDFGIAYVSDHSKTRTGIIMGSPYYMSPEQILGLKVDGRSDIFSLGVTFYQLLSGHLPFEGESIATVAYQITKAKPIGVNQHNPELPPSAQRIIKKSMHKDIEKRYQSMAEFKLALVNALKRDFKTTVN